MRRQGLAPRTGVVHGFAWIEGRGTGVVHVRPRHSPCPRFRRRRPSPRTFVDGPTPDSPHGISLRTVPRRNPVSCAPWDFTSDRSEAKSRLVRSMGFHFGPFRGEVPFRAPHGISLRSVPRRSPVSCAPWDFTSDRSEAKSRFVRSMGFHFGPFRGEIPFRALHGISLRTVPRRSPVSCAPWDFTSDRSEAKSRLVRPMGFRFGPFRGEVPSRALHGISLRTVPRRSPMSCVGGGRRGETGGDRIQKACPGPLRPSPDENLVGNEKPLPE